VEVSRAIFRGLAEKIVQPTGDRLFTRQLTQ